MFLEFLRIQNGLQFYVVVKYSSQIRSLIIYAVSHKRMPTFISARRHDSAVLAPLCVLRQSQAVTASKRIDGSSSSVASFGHLQYKGSSLRDFLSKFCHGTLTDHRKLST